MLTRCYILEIFMENQKISTFVIEFRRNIQAGNVFIKFNSKLADSQTKVLLKSHEIIIQIDNEEYTIETGDFFNINVKSFYNLCVKDNFISFRFITANGEDFVVPSTNEGIKYQKLKLNVSNENDVKVTCSNCDSLLTIEKEINFKRVLELPSSNMAISDWFCHRHDGDKLFQSGHCNNNNNPNECFNEETQMFKPKMSDIFYGPFHLLLNARHFELNRFRPKKNTNLMHCKRCLQLLCQMGNSSLMFWWENVKLNGKFLYSDIETPADLVKWVICNHVSCDSLSYLSPIIKIIFESINPNSGHKIHILLQIMDKNLKLLKLKLDDFKLTEVKTIKVMYLKLDHQNSDDDERTLKYWQKDINTMTFEFSFKMFHLFSEYLEKQSDMIPEMYRYNNSFQLSYIEIM